jgi:hypothetical protein
LRGYRFFVFVDKHDFDAIGRGGDGGRPSSRSAAYYQEPTVSAKPAGVEQSRHEVECAVLLGRHVDPALVLAREQEDAQRRTVESTRRAGAKNQSLPISQYSHVDPLKGPRP